MARNWQDLYSGYTNMAPLPDPSFELPPMQMPPPPQRGRRGGSGMGDMGKIAAKIAKKYFGDKELTQAAAKKILTSDAAYTSGAGGAAASGAQAFAAPDAALSGPIAGQALGGAGQVTAGAPGYIGPGTSSGSAGAGMAALSPAMAAPIGAAAAPLAIALMGREGPQDRAMGEFAADGGMAIPGTDYSITEDDGSVFVAGNQIDESQLPEGYSILPTKGAVLPDRQMWRIYAGDNTQVDPIIQALRNG